VSRLIGAPPGYVGFDQGGLLTEAISKQPHCVLLLDEIEKAHPDVLHMLLQILEEGRLTDSVGRQIDFRNTVVILTSNLGHGAGTMAGGLGFSDVTETANYEQLRNRMLEAAKRSFKPEFLNRIDEVIVFRELTRADVEEILELADNDPVTCAGPIHYRLRAVAVSDDFLADGTLDTELRLRCRRCDCVFAGTLENLAYHYDQPLHSAPEYVDLTADIREAIMLAFPSYPVCRPDCKGLCPQCGTNRNEHECECRPPPDSSWSVLSGL